MRRRTGRPRSASSPGPGADPLRLHHDPALIEPGRSYAVSARLLDRTGPSSARNGPSGLTRGAGDRVDALMVRLAGATETPGDAGLVGPTWVAEDIEQRGVIDRLQSHVTFTAEGRAQGSAAATASPVPTPPTAPR
jgi:hypothetical protein